MSEYDIYNYESITHMEQKLISISIVLLCTCTWL